jgi:hypothetical protein
MPRTETIQLQIIKKKEALNSFCFDITMYVTGLYFVHTGLASGFSNRFGNPFVLSTLYNLYSTSVYDSEKNSLS